MQFIGAWSVISGEQDGTLIYLLAFDSLDDRMKKWEDFHKDEWWNAQKLTHEKRDRWWRDNDDVSEARRVFAAEITSVQRGIP